MAWTAGWWCAAPSALPVERLHEPLTDELAELVAARVSLTRYLVSLGLALAHDRDFDVTE